MNGGEMIAKVLANQGVAHLFTLCGGHISPILVGAKQAGIRVIDVRDEANAVFAADAVSRLTGTPGVAAVTAGPGVTNTITALKNAQLAQSALILIGGATATFLKGRGSLQDIDQMALVKPHVKWAASIKKLRDLIPAMEQSFIEAKSGLPGPVFLEVPVDLLYDREVVQQWYAEATGKGKAKNIGDWFVKHYLKWHANKLFAGTTSIAFSGYLLPPRHEPLPENIAKVDVMLHGAKKPVLLIGSQAMLCACEMYDVADAVDKLRMPVYLAGMARGLLGRSHPLQMFQNRTQALKEADLVILAGVPNDFRLNYGRHINRRAKVISINLSESEMKKNRKPTLGVHADPGLFLIELAERMKNRQPTWVDWVATLRERDRQRDEAIAAMADEKTEGVNPLYLSREIEKAMDDDSMIVVDGGDFVAGASYILRPRKPFSWLDPGVFGTLGVGAGFALGAKLIRPHAEVWLLYGDGSAGYSIVEFDTFVRHGIPVIAVVGNDAGWTQIAREQVEMLHDDVGTVLRHTNYHQVAEGYGAKGFSIRNENEIPDVLQEAKAAAKAGSPVLINVLIGKTQFRKGSISM